MRRTSMMTTTMNPALPRRTVTGQVPCWWIPSGGALTSSASSTPSAALALRLGLPSSPFRSTATASASAGSSSSSDDDASGESSSTTAATTTTAAGAAQGLPLWVPDNPPTLEEVVQSGWVGNEEPARLEERVYQAAFPGHVVVSEEAARRAPLRRVAASLFSGLEREGRLPSGREERVWAKWEAALARLERERGVVTLHDLAALPRVAWWRTRLPPAFRSALNTFLYHQHLPYYAIPRTTSSSSSSASSASTTSSASA